MKFEKKDGHEYEPESLAVMQRSLDRHSKNCGRNYSILRDHEVKARELWAQGYGKWKNASHALCEADEEFLWNLGQLVKHSASAIVKVKFKNVTEHLIWPSWETRVLPLKEDLPKRGKEGYGIAKRAVKPKMFTTTGKKCPVMLLEKCYSGVCLN